MRVITINTPGPQGPIGPAGPQGPTGQADTSSLVTTSSFNNFTGSYLVDSASFNNRISEVNTSLAFFTTTSSFNQFTSSYKQDSASFDSRINTSNTGSFTGSFTGSLLGTSSFSFTSSFINTLNQNAVISGSLAIITDSGTELQVINTGIKIGNTNNDIHTITGSLKISGSAEMTTGGTQHNYRAPGFWYTAGENASQLIATAHDTGSATNNYVYLCPWIVTKTITITSGAFHNTNTNTGRGVYGIYNSDPVTLKPTSLITSSILNLSPANVVKTSSFASPVTLTPGLYYTAFALTSSGVSSVTLRSLPAAAIAPVLGRENVDPFSAGSGPLDAGRYTHFLGLRPWNIANGDFSLPVNGNDLTTDSYGSQNVCAIAFKYQ